ncbi:MULTISPECIES: hypothetical protein [Halococcus]|uniref:hypothetical protein n=1 Tax=Halococcus TaxID=2249 RepID=UPI000677DCF0|nr:MULTISPECIES: hypothetical protein [Halococcus]
MNRIQRLGAAFVIAGATGLLLRVVETDVASPIVTFGFLLVPIAFLCFLSYHAVAYLGYA